MSSTFEKELLSLRWNNYQSSLTSAFESMRSDEDFVDVTLGCEGKRLPSHRMLLSACSPYFRDLLKGNPCQHPIIILRETKYEDLKCILEFMYQGEISIEQGKLDSFLRTAESLKIRGLTQEKEDLVDQKPNVSGTQTNLISIPKINIKRENNFIERGMQISSSTLFDRQLATSGPSSQKRLKSDKSFASVQSVICRPSDGHSVFDTEEMEDIISLDNEPQHVLLTDDVERGQGEYAVDEAEIYNGEFDTEAGNSLFQEGASDSTESVPFGNSFEHCGVVYPDIASFQQHINQCHSREFCCNFCDKTFTQNSYLKKHMAVHLGHTRCTICQKTFCRVYYLNNHLRRVHNLNP